MRDDVGLCEVSRGVQVPFHLVEETEIEVDLRIGGAIERADLRARAPVPQPATGNNAVAIDFNR